MCIETINEGFVISSIVTGVKLGHVKNALFGVLSIAMYTTPKSL